MSAKRFLASIVILASAASCSSTTAHGPIVPGTSCGTLVLTGHPSYPPVAWATGNTLEGGGIQVVRRLAKSAGVKVVVVNENTWENAQGAVRDGAADAIVGIYETQERKAFLNYVHPALAPDPSAVVIRPGESFAYKNWNSLIGKHGAAGSGESYGSQFDAFAQSKLTLDRLPTLEDVYAAVIGGKVDYGLSGYYAAVTGAPKGKIAFATTDFVTEGLYLAFGKQTACQSLSAAFSSQIRRMRADGTIDKIFKANLERYERTH